MIETLYFHCKRYEKNGISSTFLKLKKETVKGYDSYILNLRDLKDFTDIYYI